MEDKKAEATDSLSKDTGGIVGLDRPLDSLDLTKILAKEFEEKEQESEEPSTSGGVVEEAEPVVEIEPTEETAEEATNTEHDLSQNESEMESEPVANLKLNRSRCSGGLIASPANYVWRRRSATNWVSVAL